MKKSLSVAIAVVLLAVGAFGAWVVYSQSGPIQPNPRALVPPSVDLYVEAAPFDTIDTGLAQIAAALNFPYNRSELAARMTGAAALFVQDPAGAGMDRARPLGFAGTGLGTRTWIPVAYIPIRDADAAAKTLKVEAKALRAGPVSTDAGWAALLEGYLVVSDSEIALRDLLALKVRGITVSGHDTHALVAVYIMPRVLRDASTFLKTPGSETMPKPAQVLGTIAAEMLESVEALRTELHWTAAGFRMRTAFALKPGSPALKALGAPSAQPPLLNLLPPGGVMAGMRIDPAGSRALGERVLEAIKPLLEDSSAYELLRAGLDFVAEESAMSFLEWNVQEPGKVRTISIQTLPEGREDEFAAMVLTLRKKGGEIWESMMAGTGHPASKMTFTDLPQEVYDPVAISVLESRTSIEFDPVPNANAETLRMLENLKDQRMQERHARVMSADGKTEFWVSATGDDTGTIRTQIDRLRGGSSASALEHPAVQKVIAMFEGGTAAFAIIDPTAFNSPEPTLGGAFGITGRVAGDELRVEIVWPREHLAVIPQIIMGVMMGGMGAGMGAGM
jgi:hypothetical protein